MTTMLPDRSRSDLGAIRDVTLAESSGTQGEVTELSQEIHHTRKSSRVVPSRTRNKRSTTFNLGLLTVRYETSEVPRRSSGHDTETQPVNRQHTVEVRLPARFLPWGIYCASSGIYGDWTRTWQTFRYVSEDSLIVQYCMDGDVENVQRLFQWGLARPSDRIRCFSRFSIKTDDWSLLHVSYACCYEHTWS